MEFLVAAHVKKRSECTDEERRDLHHVAMLACTFGCDALYESGWITVDQHGRIRASSPSEAPEGTFKQRLLQLEGRSCTAHTPASEPYFAWHRSRTLLGRTALVPEDAGDPCHCTPGESTPFDADPPRALCAEPLRDVSPGT